MSSKCNFSVLFIPGMDHELDSKISFMGMKLYLVANVESKGGVLSLSTEAKLCADFFSTCLAPVEIFHDMKFGRAAQHVRNKRG